MKYRKKPVVIEAEPFKLDETLPFRGHGDPVKFDGAFYIETLESNRHMLTDGDMIIRGVKGEFYACKPDIFAMTYDAVED